MSFLDERCQFRATRAEVECVIDVVEKSQDRYDNFSHFIRCAMLKLLREELAKSLRSHRKSEGEKPYGCDTV